MQNTVSKTTQVQRASWSRGDFHRIGVSQLVVGELLVRELHVHAGERVLDVAGGAGNTALAAARRNAVVTCTDYVPQILSQARRRAGAEGLSVDLVAADAQALPFPDASFDVVTSTFGAMFAPDQRPTAAELLRVLRPGGRLGMANWTPESWVAANNRLRERYLPPPAELPSPTRWGSQTGLAELFTDGLAEIRLTDQHTDFVHHNTTALFELFKNHSGGMSTVLAQLQAAQADAFSDEWIQLAEHHNIANDDTCEIPSHYLQVVAVKKE